MSNKQTTEKNLDALQREYDSANAELQKLQDERSTLNARLTQASSAETVDAEALINLQTRGDELPRYVYAAEIKARRACIALLEAHHADSAAKADAAIVAVSELYERFLAAQKVYNEATWQRDNARAEAGGDRAELTDARLALEKYIRANAPSTAPIVRSIPHAV